MSKNIYKEYLKKQKVRQKYDEEVVVNEQKSFIKILLFLFEIMIRIFRIVLYRNTNFMLHWSNLYSK